MLREQEGKEVYLAVSLREMSTWQPGMWSTTHTNHKSTMGPEDLS